MITYKAIIIPNNRRKDGTYPVKIRVTFKGKTRRLPTTLVCTSNDLTRSLKIKNPDILSKADELIIRMRESARDISPFDLENKDVDWVVSRIKDKLSGENFRLDFFAWSDTFLLTKKEGTRDAYVTAVNALERFLGRRSLDINDITKSMLLDFVDFIEDEPKMCRNRYTGGYVESSSRKVKGASSRHVAKLHHIFDAAKSRYNDEDEDKIVIPKSPFDKIQMEQPKVNGQRNLGVPLMQRIISYETKDKKLRFALDTFIVSFGLMGANMADLYIATPVKDVWVYNRIKTTERRIDKAEMRVYVPAVLDPFIRRLQGVKDKSLWLPSLHSFGCDKDQCTGCVNRQLSKWCRQNDVPEFTFYAARHTWATLARKAGVEKATVDEGLAHKGDFAITDIYAERDWDLINEANRRVLDIFEWK